MSLPARDCVGDNGVGCRVAILRLSPQEIKRFQESQRRNLNTLLFADTKGSPKTSRKDAGWCRAVIKVVVESV